MTLHITVTITSLATVAASSHTYKQVQTTNAFAYELLGATSTSTVASASASASGGVAVADFNSSSTCFFTTDATQFSCCGLDSRIGSRGRQGTTYRCNHGEYFSTATLRKRNLSHLISVSRSLISPCGVNALTRRHFNAIRHDQTRVPAKFHTKRSIALVQSIPS
jgi:hypothetical protein